MAIQGIVGFFAMLYRDAQTEPRVRRLHSARGQRTGSAARCDPAPPARAESTGREESQQAGAAGEAQDYRRLFGPRFKALVGSRFSNLAGDFGVCQPLAYNL